MKYFAIDIFAVKEIITSQYLQSADYEEGAGLVSFLRDDQKFEIKGLIKSFKAENGTFLLTPEKDDTKLLVFNREAFHGFRRPNDQEIITILQKACRLAIKLWQKIGLSPCEKPIGASNYIALFPFPFNVANKYKVILDQITTKKTSSEDKDHNLYIFQDGTGNNYVNDSSPILFLAIKEYKLLPKWEIGGKDASDTHKKGYLTVSHADAKKSTDNPFMGMEYWENNLTNKQKDFVYDEKLGPAILKGAAGTGKTLCLILRCINQLKLYKKKNAPLKSVFFTHSIATKESIEMIMRANGGEEFLSEASLQRVDITTLQEWCIEYLAGRIYATEYLDKDALESKNTQLLHISEAVDEFLSIDLKSSQQFISEGLSSFFDKNDPWSIAIYMQYEISVFIKGRANDDFDVYKKLSRSKNSIPLETEDDYRTIYHIHNNYQKRLEALGYFDSDDITISALQETVTPIWKRRRMKDGYDVLYIDETHLFNLNELSLFHNLLKSDNTNIIFTIDRAQAPGDAAVSEVEIYNSIEGGGAEQHEIGLQTIFRCSNDILNLAACILSSGATLFSSMENPVCNTNTGFTETEERLAETPYVKESTGTKDLIVKAFQEVDLISKRIKKPKHEILLVPCDEYVLNELKHFSKSNGLGLTSIERRGDFKAVEQAQKKCDYLTGAMDYIGGLEFPAIVIVGIDKDKFPKRESMNSESNHFLKYNAFKQLYVTVTRAKYIVAFINDKTQGLSDVVMTAFSEGLIVKK